MAGRRYTLADGVASHSVSFCRSLPDDYDGQLYKAHCEVLYATLLIHLDDSSEHMKVIGY